MEQGGQRMLPTDQAMTDLSSLKRKSDNPPEPEPKRPARFERQELQPVPDDIRPSMSNKDAQDDSGSDEEAEFFDAEEQLPSSVMSLDESYGDDFFSQMLHYAGQNALDSGENSSSSDDEYHEAFETLPTEQVAESHISEANNSAITEDAESNSGDENDLFALTFGTSNTKVHEDDKADKDDNESDVEITSVQKIAPADSQPTIQELKAGKPESSTRDLFLETIHAQGYDFVPCEHTSGCTCDPIQRMSTPPPQPDPYRPVSVPKLPQALSPALDAYQRLHARAKLVIPELSLGDSFDRERRYWIAVLPLGRKPKKAMSTKDFIWMKGNKFSTVATVWHTYQTTTMADPDELVLLLGRERVEMTVQAQELDYFNDKLVVFRAVRASDPEAKGKALTEGLVPEVIELD